MTAKEPNIVALLPMKAHSERVPGKNFKNLGGRPLFRWILDTLLSIEEISRVVINTDARQILEENGLVDGDRILIRDRRPEICGDLVSMNAVLRDDIDQVAGDAYVMTHTTNPFLRASTIRDALAAYRSGVESGNADSLFTVNKFQTRFYRADGSPVNHDPAVLLRTQDLEPWFEENSCLYVFSRDSFDRTGARIGGSPILFETESDESLDIDTPIDWDLAAGLVESGFAERHR